MTRITFLVHRGKEYTVQKYLGSWGRDLAVPARARNYPALRSRGRTPWKRLEATLRGWRLGVVEEPGEAGSGQVYVFTDVDRLNELETEVASSLHKRLSKHPDTARVLNHPRRSMRRRQLLDTLHRRGINDFGVYRVDGAAAGPAPQPRSWPVFVRSESDHGGMSALLHTPRELERELERRRGTGSTLVIEYCDARSSDGVVRKYGAFRVGGRILARQIHFSRDWVVRFPDIRVPETAREELEYVRSNPHRDPLREIFDLARIDYGRADYSVVGGRIQVWEINTNPMILIPKDRDDPLRAEAHDHFGRAFNQALEALTSGSPP